MHPSRDYEIFVRVADRKSFTAAGRELRLSTAVVSSRIAKLEARLGLKLLVRNTREVNITEEGRIYYDFCQKMISEFAELEQRFEEVNTRPSGALKVSAPVSIGRHFVAPVALDFQATHRDVQIRLELTDRVANIIEEDIDLAVRTGDPEDSSLMSTAIASDVWVVCGAPSYFQASGEPATPEQLEDHNCLLLRFPGSRRYFWRMLNERGEPANFRVSGDIDSNSSDVLIDWAVAGRGLVLQSIWDVHHHIVSGALRPALLRFVLPGQSINAIMPPRKPQPAKTMEFVALLRDAFSSHPSTVFTDPEGLMALTDLAGTAQGT